MSGGETVRGVSGETVRGVSGGDSERCEWGSW